MAIVTELTSEPNRFDRQERQSAGYSDRRQAFDINSISSKQVNSTKC